MCEQCRHETDEKSFATSTGVDAKRLKAAVPTPVYLFSGLVLLVIGAGFLIFNFIQNREMEKGYAQNPNAGDVYLLRNDEEPTEYKYYLVKVRRVVDDSLEVSNSAFSYNIRVSELDPRDGFYRNVIFRVHKDEVKGLQESGDLQRVFRNYAASTGFFRDVEFEESEYNE